MSNKTIRVVGCFLHYQDTFLILHRRSDKPDANTWGLPAGKVQPNETDEVALLRELKEETGYEATPDELEFLGVHIYNFPEFTLEFPTYRIYLNKPIDVQFQSSEHTEFKWVTPAECYAMPHETLIRGLPELMDSVGYAH